MKIRRFFASDMRQAIRMVREEQGPDAVILSSRRVEGGIEIVSAMDYDQELVTGMAGEPAAEAPAQAPAPAGADDAMELLDTGMPWVRPARAPEPESRAAQGGPPAGRTPPGIVWSQDPALVAMQREIESLRGMLQDQLASLAWNDLSLREPERAQLIRDLGRLGIDPALARDIAHTVRHLDSREHAWQEALQHLARRIPAAPESSHDPEGIVTLVGPSGVGKTTTVAKLAARHVQAHGRHSLALVTTDAYRIGAHRQLQTFGQILGVPVHLAQTARELGDILSGLQGKQRIFVDTAGMSQRDLSLAEEIAGLAAIPHQRSLLVVAANTQQAVLEETFRAFGGLSLEGVVLTKVDEAVSLGPAMSALCTGGLPLMYVSEGQRVPEDLSSARASRLVSQAVSFASEDREEGDGNAHGHGLRQPQTNRNGHAHVSA
ncbi:flagellar biosynthesis protein FlhF [Thioalkalivibrio sp.]|uniref:flagellar biosynthesis protein FlhF n=1 Tax=Thioalkalivibrio sp. TaxID=2093813 RepID=UPI00397546CE